MAYLIYSILPNPRRPVVFVDHKVPVIDCVRMMNDQNIGALVVRKGHTIQGLVSERDVVRSCVLQGKDPLTTPVGDIAFRDFSTLDINESVETAMQTITNTRRRHLLVTEHGDLVAMLSIGDVLLHLLEDRARHIQHLENYITT